MRRLTSYADVIPVVLFAAFMFYCLFASPR